MKLLELPNLEPVMLDWLAADDDRSLWDLQEWLLCDVSADEMPNWSALPFQAIEDIVSSLPISEVSYRRLIDWTREYDMSLAAQSSLAHDYSHLLSDQERTRLRLQVSEVWGPDTADDIPARLAEAGIATAKSDELCSLGST